MIFTVLIKIKVYKVKYIEDFKMYMKMSISTVVFLAKILYIYAIDCTKK